MRHTNSDMQKNKLFEIKLLAKSMVVDAVILARAGSKGIPKKNLIDFCGFPLIYWTIKQCLKSKNIGKVWVSSDGENILNYSQKLGCSTIKRPPELASDLSSSEDGWIHAVNYIEENENRKIESIIVPQVTSPLRKSDDFDNGIEIFFNEGLDSLFSCTTVEDLFFWKMDPSGKYHSINYDYLNRQRRQDNPKQYIENGSFYILDTKMLRDTGNRFGNKIGVSKMEFWQTFEIDSQDDLKLCSVVMQEFLIANQCR